MKSSHQNAVKFGSFFISACRYIGFRKLDNAFISGILPVNAARRYFCGYRSYIGAVRLLGLVQMSHFSCADEWILLFYLICITCRFGAWEMRRLNRAHANGCNIVGPNMLRPFARNHNNVGTCWHFLLLVWNRSNFLGHANGRNIVMHCWPKTPNNTQQCCDLLRPFAWGFSLLSLIKN